MRWTATWLAATLAMQAHAVESGPAPAPDIWTQLQSRVERDGSPRDRALVSQIAKGAPQDSPARAHGGSALRDAARAAPADPLVQWLWATSPLVPAGCDADDACRERVWAAARLAPDNAAAWAPVLGQALAAKDRKAARMALDRMAESTYFAEPFAEMVGAWRDLLRRYPLPAAYYAALPGRGSREEANAIAAVGFTAAMVAPWHGFFSYCDAKAVAPPPAEDLARCQRVAGLMLEAPTISQRTIGTGMLRRAGGADGAAFQRQQQWWISELVAMERDGRGMLQYFDDLVSTGSEIRALELALQRAGKPLTPPADWVYVSPYADVAAAADKAAAEARAEAGEAATAPARPARP